MLTGLAVVILMFIAILGLFARAMRMDLLATRTHLTAVKRVEQKLDLLLRQAGIKYDPYPNVAPEIVEALEQGEKIRAIKLYREKTGVGLREAKDFIEELEKKAGSA